MARVYGKGYPSKRVWNKGKRKNKLSGNGMPLKKWQQEYQSKRK